MPLHDTRIRVLHTVKSLGLGGVEKVMQLLILNLDRDRFQPAVFSHDSGPRLQILQEAAIPVFIDDVVHPTLARFRPNIVHMHRAGWSEPGFMRALSVIRKTSPEPRIVETNVFGRPDPSPAGRLIDKTLLVSHFCKDRLEQYYGLDVRPPRYDVLYNPVDTALFTELCPDKNEIPPVIGRLSRADPGKWSSLALEMLPHLQQAVTDFSYRIVGGIPEAYEYVRSHGLSEHVVFEEPLLTDRELAAFFNRISVLAHANDAGESFGLAVAEAMAAGLPVVTHPCLDWKDNAQTELVEHGVTGYVASTPKEYADALTSVLTDPTKARSMGAAGRAKAQKEFDVRHITARLQAIYESIYPG